jgi:hypothetical protein
MKQEFSVIHTTMTSNGTTFIFKYMKAMSQRQFYIVVTGSPERIEGRLTYPVTILIRNPEENWQRFLDRSWTQGYTFPESSTP